MLLVVDPWDWLESDGSLPASDARVRRQALRVARLIEYAGPLRRGETRETLVECSKRPGGRACTGFMWVHKADDDTINAFCPVCRRDFMLIHNWEGTEWANGPMVPVAPERDELKN